MANAQYKARLEAARGGQDERVARRTQYERLREDIQKDDANVIAELRRWRTLNDMVAIYLGPLMVRGATADGPVRIQRLGLERWTGFGLESNGWYLAWRGPQPGYAPSLTAILTRSGLIRASGARMEAIPPLPGSTVAVSHSIKRSNGEYPVSILPEDDLGFEFAVAASLMRRMALLPEKQRAEAETYLQDQVNQIFEGQAADSTQQANA